MGSMKDKIKGKLIQAEGKVTDDKLRQAQGAAIEGKGKAKAAVERATRKVKGVVAKAKRKATAARRMP